MSRMRTSCASFSWARPALRRGGSSGVRVLSGPLGFALSVATVEAGLVERGRDRGWHEAFDGFSPWEALADLIGRDRRRGQLERQHPLAVALEVRRRIARARADGEAHPAEHLVGLLPGREGGALVRADDEDRVAEAAPAPRVHRERVKVEYDLVRETVDGKVR